MTKKTTKKSGAQLQREVDTAVGSGDLQVVDDLAAARRRRAAGSAGGAGAARATPGVPDQAEYERRSLAEARLHLDEARRAPLAERKQAEQEFFQAMRDHPDLVAERVGWLIDGNYGYGEMMLAKQVVASPRMNQVAALTQLTAALEWRCPEDRARSAWKKLSPAQQHRLDRAVRRVVDRAIEAAEA